MQPQYTKDGGGFMVSKHWQAALVRMVPGVAMLALEELNIGWAVGGRGVAVARPWGG